MNTKEQHNQEEVIYKNNSDNITLCGTLSFPSNSAKSPAVILISGMGPNDRDYTMGSHKLFLVLSDYLTKQGIAVLRFDKRGVGKSTGKFDLTLTSKDFANDVLAGVEYLKTRKEIDSKQIGLIGHSEGGMIAPMVAAKSNNISFLVLLAGVVTTNIKDNIAQVAMQLTIDGASKELIEYDSKLRKQLLEIIKKEIDLDTTEKQLQKLILKYLHDLPRHLKIESEKFLFTINESNYEKTIKILNSPWYRFLINHNPIETLKKIKCPLLAINGYLDFITSSKIALPIISQVLKNAGHKNYKTVEFTKLNHWLQECKTGSISEYGKTKETMSSVVLKLVSKWILDQKNLF